MSIPPWKPPVEPSEKEEWILERLKRHRKLFAFLRLRRHEILNDAFQAELAAMYRDTGAGEPPNSPAMLCMVILLQGYTGASDAEAVEASVMDTRWQLVLDCVGSEEPPFSQGGLQQFRERFIEHDMDQRLLERMVEVARASKGFDWRKVPKLLKVAMDSRPLVGAGRVEDIFNLLGHAARKVIACASKQACIPSTTICDEASCSLFLATSIKAGLDIDWNDAEQKNEAINRLVDQVDALVRWVEEELPQRSADDPIQYYMDALEEFQEQDLERTTEGTVKIRDGVAKDRRVSVEDREMRHGRKSKKKTFTGYKEHVAGELVTHLILACALTPANQPEQEAADMLKADIECQGFEIGELSVDRGYVNSLAAEQVEQEGGEVLCKSWRIANNNKGLFAKTDFDINIRDKTVTCPAGHTKRFELGKKVEFDPESCAQCSLRSKCTRRKLGRGREVQIAADEPRQKRLRKLQSTKKGRKRLRARTEIEHQLAHVSGRKGPRARYIGMRKNLYDLRRTAAVQNLQTVQRKEAA